jgi:hypothetical protein
MIQPTPSAPDPPKPEKPDRQAKPSVPPKEGLSDFDIVMEKIALEIAPSFWNEQEKK